MDPTPTELFEAYEGDFKHLINDIKDKLEGSGKSLQGEQRKAALRKVELSLDEADDIVSQLDIEIQGIPTSIRAQYASRLRQAKADLTRYRKLSKDSHAQTARSELVGSSGFGGRGVGVNSDDPYGERGDRSRLLAGTEILDDGTRRITDSTRIALETETQGADILRSLRGQREQVENSRDQLRGADTNIDRASGKIQTMIRQMHKQKVIYSLIGVFFVALIAVILYFKLRR